MVTERRTMPIGVDDFREIVTKKYCFVDKTRFIKEILDGHSKVTLITRPRRFGKTLNLSMLRYFFTMENREKNRGLFVGLDIERAGDRYMAEQGSRPVVFLTLKGAQARDYDGMIVKLSELLRQVYDRVLYLQDSEAISLQDKEYFKSVLNTECPPDKLQFALANLTKFLQKHHGREAILLLDEYDAPIISAWERGYYDDCIDFMRGFLGEALKTNEALDFAVLTGVTRVSKESIFSVLNNLRVCSVLNERYGDIFGFTQEEADCLLDMCGLENSSGELKKWYDGYLFGGKEIYNPWSVISFIDNDCIFQPYWLNISGNSILQVLLKRVDEQRRKELTGLLRMGDSSVNALVDEGIICTDIENDENALYMMLLTTGYLKAVTKWQDGRSRWWCSLQIPNREVMQAYEDEVLSQVAGRGNLALLLTMLEAMTEGKVGVLKKQLERILRDMVSFHDTAQPESFYHGLMLGLSAWLEGRYRVESNRESGYGRFDIAFFPLKEKMPGVILEFKTVKTEEEMEEAARAALTQIESKEYTAELARQGVTEVWKYGIAFCGKKIWLEHR